MNGTRRRRTSSSRNSSVPDVSLSAKILEAQDNERRRISRELHDSVGQSLVAAKLAIGRLKHKFSDADLDEVESMVDEALTEVRTVSHLLYPPMLDLMGLRSAIVWYAEGFERRTGIKASIDISSSLPKLDATASTTLFRIIQETLTNIHKHADATAITIRVDFNTTELSLVVTDNGAGFSDGSHEGVGIRGMRERLRELGGKLYIESDETGGSSVTAMIPLNHPDNPEDRHETSDLENNQTAQNHGWRAGRYFLTIPDICRDKVPQRFFALCQQFDDISQTYRKVRDQAEQQTLIKQAREILQESNTLMSKEFRASPKRS